MQSLKAIAVCSKCCPMANIQNNLRVDKPHMMYASRKKNVNWFFSVIAFVAEIAI